VVITTLFSIIFAHVLPRRTLRDVAGAHTFAGGFTTMPSWDFPPQGVDYHDHAMIGKVISIAIRFAIVGLLESLMTEALIDQITGTQGSARRECFGQGVGNILSSFFGTQGGCALIAQSLMNVGSGGRTRVSGVVMGITLGLCVVILSPLMAAIPVAALVGLICLIALNTFAWSSLELITRINKVDALVVVLVTVVTVWKDLCVAVVIGVIINSLCFAWQSATEVKVQSTVAGDRREFKIEGPLFFGSAMSYVMEVDPHKVPEKEVVLNFEGNRILDISGVEAITKARENLVGAGKKVVLKGVPGECLRHMPPEAEKEVEA
jgi:SulP family sulfate permease